MAVSVKLVVRGRD